MQEEASFFKDQSEENQGALRRSHPFRNVVWDTSSIIVMKYSIEIRLYSFTSSRKSTPKGPITSKSPPTSLPYDACNTRNTPYSKLVAEHRTYGRVLVLTQGNPKKFWETAKWDTLQDVPAIEGRFLFRETSGYSYPVFTNQG